ncbi:2'-5' RNA ligase family protein [Nitrosomonas sp.]|uniref:2'-5' RNA ligase family protein n=1 Tax=Nitrosomonas sp. TaxID=42353 RepID=UPI00258C16DC|nr:2'-5' RNA ligase family protein [Nitrosomonas sp.]
MSDAASSVRLFFALWPQEEARKQLARLARRIADQCAGRCVRPENLHLTLAFIGEVDSSVGVGMPPAVQDANMMR